MATSMIQRPSGGDLVTLTVAVLAVSTSAPIIAAAAVAPLALAFWRCLIGGLLTAPVALWRGLGALTALNRDERRQLVLASVWLAAHFAVWIPSLSFTSVSSAAALIATQPVWSALIVRATGHQVPGRVWLGITVSLLGVLVLTGIDASLDPRSLIGDGLALAGAVLAAFYVQAGETARQSISTSVYSFSVYLGAAALLLPVSLVFGAALWGYPKDQWVLILVLTLVAQLLGHTLINHALARTSATVVSLAILFELPGAVVIAALWLGQVPPLTVIPALVLLFAGLASVIRGAEAAEPLESPPV